VRDQLIGQMLETTKYIDKKFGVNKKMGIDAFFCEKGEPSRSGGVA